MPRFVFVVFTAPKEGQEDQYNAWYDSRHLGETIRVDGIVSGERFVLADPGAEHGELPKYLAIYEVEADNVTDVQAALASARETRAMPSSDSLDRSSIRASFYSPLPAPSTPPIV